MPVGTKLKLTRNQLSTVFKDHETLRQFEQLIDYMNSLIPEDGTSSFITANNAETRTNQLSSEINEIKKQVESNEINANEAMNKALSVLSNMAVVISELEAVKQSPIKTPHNSIVVDYIDMAKSIEPAHRSGRVHWDLEQETMNIDHPGGVIQQVGQEIYIRVTNDTLATFTNGELIGFEVSGGAINTIPYIADATIPIKFILGVATQEILPGEQGRITTFGQVNDIDTTGTPYGEVWVVGDILYASPTISGGLTKVKPTAPNFSIPLGAVLNVSATVGAFFIRVTSDQEMYYGAFTRNTDQSPAVINTAYALAFDTTESSNGVTLAGAPLTQLTVPESGVYSINYTMHIESSSASSKEFYTWFAVNGVDVPNSTVSATTTGSNNHTVLTRGLFFALNKADYVEVMYAGSSTNIIIDHDNASLFAPASPACTITVEQIQQ